MASARVCAGSAPWVYDPAMAVSALPAAAAIDSVPHWIDGRSVRGTGRQLDVFNPATGEVTRRVALAGAEEVRAAVASARGAWPAWADTPPVRRARVLARFLPLPHQRRAARPPPLTHQHRT